MILWINDKIEREAVVCALYNNGYTIRKIKRPNEKYPVSMTDAGIEIIPMTKVDDIVIQTRKSIPPCA